MASMVVTWSIVAFVRSVSYAVQIYSGIMQVVESSRKSFIHTEFGFFSAFIYRCVNTCSKYSLMNSV